MSDNQIKSGVALCLENKPKMSLSNKLELIQELMGGPQPDCQYCGQPQPDKPQVITLEQAKALLGFPDQIAPK